MRSTRWPSGPGARVGSAQRAIRLNELFKRNLDVDVRCGVYPTLKPDVEGEEVIIAESESHPNFYIQRATCQPANKVAKT